MKVRVKVGTLGWRDENGYLRPKKAGEVCEVEDTEGERLLSLGAVETAEDGEGEPEETAEVREGEPEETPEVGEGEPEETAEDGEDEQEETPEAKAQKEFSSLTVAELRELCIGAGMRKAEAKKATKAACVAFLTEYVYPHKRPAAQTAHSPAAGSAEDIIV